MHGLTGREHAKNPEGASAETSTLSGFSTRWNSYPEGLVSQWVSKVSSRSLQIRFGVAPDSVPSL